MLKNFFKICGLLTHVLISCIVIPQSTTAMRRATMQDWTENEKLREAVGKRFVKVQNFALPNVITTEYAVCQVNPTSHEIICAYPKVGIHWSGLPSCKDCSGENERERRKRQENLEKY